MALESFIAGPSVGYYNTPARRTANAAPLPLGLTDQGYTLRFMPVQEVIDASDIYGGALLDAVKRGHRATIQFDLLSYARAIVNGIFWQTSSHPLTLWEAGSPCGVLYSELAGQLVMATQANTPSAAFDALGDAGDVFGASGTLTANLAILTPGSEVSIISDSRLRHVPLSMSLLPYSATGVAGDPVIFALAS